MTAAEFDAWEAWFAAWCIAWREALARAERALVAAGRLNPESASTGPGVNTP